MGKKITFKARTQYGFDTQIKPYPASSAIPQWWKDEPPYSKIEGVGDSKIFVDGRATNASFKKCTPMLDALTSGYIVSLWADVHVRQENGFPIVSWRTRENIFELHGESSKNVEPPTGYSNTVFKYLNTWIPITPSGYSCLVTSPFGYKNLPFHAVPAVIDSDKSKLEIIPPMWIKDGFEGIVEKGTPLFQIIPFKRESWESNFDFYKDDEYIKEEERTFNGTLVNHYIKKVWSKKVYK